MDFLLRRFLIKWSSNSPKLKSFEFTSWRLKNFSKKWKALSINFEYSFIWRFNFYFKVLFYFSIFLSSLDCCLSSWTLLDVKYSLKKFWLHLSATNAESVHLRLLPDYNPLRELSEVLFRKTFILDIDDSQLEYCFVRRRNSLV